MKLGSVGLDRINAVHKKWHQNENNKTKHQKLKNQIAVAFTDVVLNFFEDQGTKLILNIKQPVYVNRHEIEPFYPRINGWDLLFIAQNDFSFLFDLRQKCLVQCLMVETFHARL